jgi:hypothetical protein
MIIKINACKINLKYIYVLQLANFTILCMRHFNKHKLTPILTIVAFCFSSFALANTGSTELNPVLTFLQDNLNGIVGKLIVITSVLVGLITCVIKFNAYIIAGCAGTALFALYGDNFLI